MHIHTHSCIYRYRYTDTHAHTYTGEACSLPSDVYAFGVMLNEIFSREIPFGGLDVGDVKAKVGRGLLNPKPLTPNPKS